MSNGSRFAATFLLCGLLCCQVSAAEEAAPHDSLSTNFYRVGDIRQAGSPDANSPLPLPEIVQFIRENVAPDSWKGGDHGPSIVPHAGAQCLIVRQTEQNHEAIAELLQGLRNLCDVQVSLELRIVQMPDAFAAQWTEPRVLSNDEWQKALDVIEAEPQAELLYAPKITLLNGQRGTVSMSNSPKTPSIHLTGVVSADRRIVNTKIHFDYPVQPSANSLAEFSIPDFQTAFVGYLEDRPGLIFDRAHLVENGIKVAQKSAAKTLVFLTPRVIVSQEEEEALSKEINRSVPISSVISTCSCRYECFCPVSSIPRDEPNLNYPETWEELKKSRPLSSSQKSTEQPSAN
ncbi:hypothetical protein [Planctomicrobium piriforme]|uniref:Uncharacterized protein n=1 Tax=Planctomicrobium piriforme TaxID=1576369 RepID=A0A1I3J5X8_9PLAN|nr:hypothetical protein [Planctomicrobium piriforme]SFI55295.1 hypothetical protein SAMN05421753_11060 [Planctomicrobium piriforme]